jgi:hypothetical protein
MGRVIKRKRKGRPAVAFDQDFAIKLILTEQGYELQTHGRCFFTQTGFGDADSVIMDGKDQTVVFFPVE